METDTGLAAAQASSDLERETPAVDDPSDESRPRPRTGTAAKREKPIGRTAILVVNGFDRRSQKSFNEEEAERFPWIDVCLRQIERYTPRAAYRVFVWDNSQLESHRQILDSHRNVKVSRHKRGKDVRHGPALDLLLAKVPEHFDYVVTMDTDSFPVRHGWLANLVGRLDDGATTAGVWREEMAEKIEPYVHPSCFAARRDTLARLGVDFTLRGGQDVGHNITRAVLAEGGRISRLRRSNTRNLHFLMGAVYGDLIYHQGAGSRHAKFHVDSEHQHDEAVRIALRDAVFHDVDALIDFLEGNLDAEAARARGLGPVADLAERETVGGRG